MTKSQELWWLQASSDHQVLLLVRRRGVEACHQLHYLQMVTEKLAKAYFWRGGSPPNLSHRAFVRFLRALDDRSKQDRQRIATLLGYKDFNELARTVQKLLPLAYELERLAPALAGPDRPNPEYPWPANPPTATPSTYEFPIWKQLTEITIGRQLLQFIDRAVATFPQYA